MLSIHKKLIKIPKDTKILLLVSLVLFLLMLCLVSKINFPQNDDWVYYENIELIKKEGLKLDPYMGPTFFVQGIFGALYSYIFPISSLPLLTLFFSVLSFFIFTKILTDCLKINTFLSILLGLMLYLVPVNIYTSLGFMTEQYFFPWFLASIYLFLEYQKSSRKMTLTLLLLVIFIALNQRQVALVLPVSFFVYYLFNKKLSKALVFLTDFFAMLFYYLFLFPRTEAMMTKSFAFNHLFEFDYIYALVYGGLIIVSALLIPLFSMYVFQSVKKYRVLFVTLVCAVFFILNANFKPMEISWGEFPYFENTWERMGFYPRGVLGTKYQFIGNYDLYTYWDLFSKILLSSFIVTLFFKFKKFFNIFAIIAFFYFGILVVTDTFYDRYILFLIPLFILSLSQNIVFKRYSYYLISVFVLFMGFYAYQFSMDFIYVNKYIWDKSNDLIINQGVIPSSIQGTNAWKLKYRNLDKDYLYNFSYDSIAVNEVYRDEYMLVEEKEVEYPLNFFIKPKIHLYRRK